MHGLKLYGKKLDVQREFLAGQACIYHAYTMHIPCILMCSKSSWPGRS
tara:strand:+ start:181 stop:324 length:144 start_codon:yes stop_codon:yes gene_type:complete